MSVPETTEQPEFASVVEATAYRIQALAAELGTLSIDFASYVQNTGAPLEHLTPTLNQINDAAEAIEQSTEIIFGSLTELFDRPTVAEESDQPWPPMAHGDVELIPHGPYTGLAPHAEAIRQIVTMAGGQISIVDVRKALHGEKTLNGASYDKFKKHIKSVAAAGYIIQIPPNNDMIPRNTVDIPQPEVKDQLEHTRTELAVSYGPLFSDASLQDTLSIVRNAKPLPRKSRNRF